MRWARRFSKFRSNKRCRYFSVTSGSTKTSTPLSFKIFKPSGSKLFEEENKQPKIFKINSSKPIVDSSLSYTKDKAFLKFLSLVNLQSKDKECIAISRLLAYNIINQIKKESNFDKEIFKGIAYGLQLILKYLEHQKFKLNDEDILNKAWSVFSKGNKDIHKLVSYLVTGEDDKDIIFTKEVTEKPSECNVSVKYGIFMDVGYSSHSFINDHLNYRVDKHHPIIYITDELTLEDANSVIKFGLMKRTDVLFVTQSIESEAENYLISKNNETQVGISLMKISNK